MRKNKLIVPRQEAVAVKKSDIYGTDIVYEDLNLKIQLQGEHQILNAITAVEALQQLNNFGFDITKSIIEKSTPKIRYNVGKVLRLRLTPELKFVYTNGLEESSRVMDLINKISKGEIK